MPSKPNPFGGGKKPGEAGEKPAEELAPPSPAQEATVPDYGGTAVVVHTLDRDNNLVEKEFPGKTFADCEWSVSVQVLSECNKKLIINPNAVMATEQR